MKFRKVQHIRCSLPNGKRAEHAVRVFCMIALECPEDSRYGTKGVSLAQMPSVTLTQFLYAYQHLSCLQPSLQPINQVSLLLIHNQVCNQPTHQTKFRYCLFKVLNRCRRLKKVLLLAI